MIKKSNRTNKIYFSPLGKALEKQKAAIEDQEKSRIKAIEKNTSLNLMKLLKMILVSIEIVKRSLMLEKKKLTLIKLFITSNLNEKFQQSLRIIKCLKNGDVKPQEIKNSSKV